MQVKTWGGEHGLTDTEAAARASEVLGKKVKPGTNITEEEYNFLNEYDAEQAETELTQPNPDSPEMTLEERLKYIEDENKLLRAKLASQEGERYAATHLNPEIHCRAYNVEALGRAAKEEGIKPKLIEHAVDPSEAIRQFICAHKIPLHKASGYRYKVTPANEAAQRMLANEQAKRQATR